MLVATAAKRWNVDPASCRAQSGEVLHASTGRRFTYGELAADAARMPVPERIRLNVPGEFGENLLGALAGTGDISAEEAFRQFAWEGSEDRPLRARSDQAHLVL